MHEAGGAGQDNNVRGAGARRVDNAPGAGAGQTDAVQDEKEQDKAAGAQDEHQAKPKDGAKNESTGSEGNNAKYSFDHLGDKSYEEVTTPVCSLLIKEAPSEGTMRESPASRPY